MNVLLIYRKQKDYKINKTYNIEFRHKGDNNYRLLVDESYNSNKIGDRTVNYNIAFLSALRRELKLDEIR